MLKNYFKIAWRNLVRNKAYSLINIIGLSVGMASCLLIFLFIQDEMSYDQFHTKSERIYRVVMSSSLGGSAVIPAIAKNPLTEYPEIEKATRIYMTEEIVLTEDGGAYREKKFAYVDTTFFDIFSFPLIQGDPTTVLSDPNNIVLTQSAAQKYFGDVNPIGLSLTLSNGQTFQVTDIIEDVPHNSSLQFNMLASFSSLDEPKGFDYQGYLYLLLNSSEDAKPLISKFGLLTSGSPDEVSQNFGFWTKGLGFKLQSITGIHLYPALNGAIQPKSDMRYLYIFGAIGILILVIACINYMNLATANAINRAREVGMRKTLGAHRLQLMGQFLMESMLFTGAAFLLALGLAQLLLPVFGMLTGKSLSFLDILSWQFIGYALGFVMMVGFLSGSYPMVILSRFAPQHALKGVKNISNSKLHLRKALVVFQFTIAVVLIAGTVVIQKQLNYIQHKRLGYKAEHVITIPMSHPMRKRLLAGKMKPDPKRVSTFKKELSGVAGVQNISVAYAAPNGYFTSEIEYRGQTYKIATLPVDYNYLNTMKFELIAGRNFSKERANDSTRAIIINEMAARLFNLKNKVGQPININLGHENPVLIGIVKDFNTASLHHPIGATVLSIQPVMYNSYVIRIKAGSLPGVLRRLEAAWKRFAPAYPFTYHFLEEQLNKQYRTERRLGHILGIFSALAILIACLGLFGLAAYTAKRRTKEIGIRKVLGATVTNIVGLLSKDFLKLVLIGFVIAVPVAWYFMNQWLQDFAYRIDLGTDVFLLAGGMALLIALATVSWQSIRAALANPVDSLRSE